MCITTHPQNKPLITIDILNQVLRGIFEKTKNMKLTKHQQNVLLCISFAIIISVPFIWFWYITTKNVQHNESEVQIQQRYETNEGHDPVVLTYSCCQATGTLSHCPKHKLRGKELK